VVRPRLPIPLLAAGALAVAGCGAGAGTGPNPGSQLITRNFGAKVIVLDQRPTIQGSDTVMRLLQRNAHVGLRFGGKFVESINGISGGKTNGGDPIDWFFYVNGVEAGKGAAEALVHDGDRVWWDNHDWGGAMDTPAVVGSYPEPFLHGIDGKKLPTRVECVPAPSKACDTATNNLVEMGVVAGQTGFEASAGQDTLRVLVGDWTALRDDPAAALLEKPASASGVFARMAPDGRSIALLDQHGKVARTLGPGYGLVAAVRLNHGPPVWVATGTDNAGIESAAAALAEGLLANHFAVAVRGSAVTPLPVP
jgi:Domain of unknown function (DUF4430)